MNRSQFRLVVVLMSLALAGLISLQAYWIMHDLQVREQQFDQSVMMAMNDIVAKVEQQENMKIVVQNYITNGDSSTNDAHLKDSLYDQLASIVDAPLPPPPPPPPGEYAQISGALMNRVQELRKQRNDPHREGGFPLIMDSTVDIRIEKDVQQKEVVAITVHNEADLIDSIEQETAKRMESKFSKLNTMMRKLTFQISDRSRNLLDRIPPKVLDTIIKTEFTNRNIEAKCDYGITKADHRGYLYIKPGSDSVALTKLNYSITLFPNDIFKRNEQLEISFPNKFNYLISEMWPLIFSSVVFTLIMILGFIYVMRVVLRQKKLAIVKSDFINNMTHEFKTPIATIQIANESIKNPKVYSNADKMDYYTNVIRDENQRMLKQVEAVLQMAQIDKGELKLSKSEIDIKDVIEHAIASAKLTVEQRDGKLIYESTEGVIPFIGDGNHLLNVFTNLIDNANKYSPESPKITIAINRSSDQVAISISDMGIGMSKETQRKIFDTFYRATTGNIHDVKGFGLGLSYVKAIVEAHGGTVDVLSNPGEGSTFTVYLPLKNIS
jgi:two-component system phosphate regulon sensor histidine kinase PhoR